MYNIKTVETNLGYDPQIRIYGNNDLRVENGTSTTIYVHGLGENAQTVIPYNKINSFLLPGIIVGFDFPDVVPGTFASYYKKLNLAQAGDIASLSYVLKVLDESGLDIIHLFGTSRGGATIVNTLGRLCTFDTYQDFFQKLSLSKEQAARIIEKIQKGTIVLNVPLVDSNAVARTWFKFFGPTMLNYVIPRFTAHKGNEDQAINAAGIIQNKQFNILVHFEDKDERVGNNTDAAFYKKIMGLNTYLVLADDGGHLHSGNTLGHALQAFRYTHGGAYYNLPELIENGQQILKKSPPQQNEIDAFVSNSYAYFEHLRKQNR